MRSLGIKSLTIIAGLIFTVVIGTATETNAQSRREIERERQRIERQQERQRLELRRYRQRQTRRNENDRFNNGGLSRASVNATLYQGYQQGLMAGRSDRRARKYNRLNVYRNTGSAPNAGDPTSTDYLYRQGYLEGYEDGFHGRIRYQ